MGFGEINKKIKTLYKNDKNIIKIYCVFLVVMIQYKYIIFTKGEIYMSIILNIILVIVFSFIMYKSFENFDFKISWAICEGLFLVIYVIAVLFFNSGVGFFTYLIASLIAYVILTLILGKVYEKTNSYIGFLTLFLIIRLLMSFVW